MEHSYSSPDLLHLVFLVLAMSLALGFEFVNGFHDTANAVATVIYTNSLPPWVAVIWSGIWNFLGVLSSTGAVAFGVISLLPVELMLNVGSATGYAMVFSMLISAIVWNVGTWYLGLPASSSHALIGSIMGVGMMNSLMHTGSLIGGINWPKAEDVGLALLVSPVVGFLLTAVLFMLIKAILRDPGLYAPPASGNTPPIWVRAILCLTCTGVSYAHGSNDGQKGMGLLMLILVGIVPGFYALDLSTSQSSLAQLTAMSQNASATVASYASATPIEKAAATAALGDFIKQGGGFSDIIFPALSEKISEIDNALAGISSLDALPARQRVDLRSAIYLTSETIGKLNRSHKLGETDGGSLMKYKAALDRTTRYIPLWVKVAVALALGFGTTIGWRRIVVTVGEKIGKAHLTYAQGASAEMVAMVTIGLADNFGLPVSTTHVLSSGVAGAMAANKSGLQVNTLRNLVLAWVLTLPVCVFLGAMFFAAGLLLIAHTSTLAVH